MRNGLIDYRILLQNLILLATRKDRRTRPRAQSLLALLVCFTEVASMFPAFHALSGPPSSAPMGSAPMTGPLIPGAARQEKKEREPDMTMAKYGTYTARNVMREQNESR